MLVVEYCSGLLEGNAMLLFLAFDAALPESHSKAISFTREAAIQNIAHRSKTYFLLALLRPPKCSLIFPMWTFLAVF
jgi:hypothetical protein